MDNESYAYMHAEEEEEEEEEDPFGAAEASGEDDDDFMDQIRERFRDAGMIEVPEDQILGNGRSIRPLGIDPMWEVSYWRGTTSDGQEVWMMVLGTPGHPDHEFLVQDMSETVAVARRHSVGKVTTFGKVWECEKKR